MLFRSGRQHHDVRTNRNLQHDVKRNRNLQDPSTNRSTSVLSGTESHQLYERIYDSDEEYIFVNAPTSPVERPDESKDSIAMDERQDPTTNRPTSVLSGTESHQLYERIYDSDEEYIFVTAPTTPSEQSSQQHQNPLPLLTDVSSRLRSMQANHSPPQPVYSYCDVLPTKTSLKSDDQPHHSTNGQGAGVSVHGGRANASKLVRVENRRPVLTTPCNGQKKNNPESNSQIPAVSVTITSHGIELKLSSSTMLTRASKS